MKANYLTDSEDFSSDVKTSLGNRKKTPLKDNSETHYYRALMHQLKLTSDSKKNSLSSSTLGKIHVIRRQSSTLIDKEKWIG
jgi:hypothetical protein